jgi:hypothetical protein
MDDRGKQTVCEVHHANMHTQTVPIEYGLLMRPDPEFATARERDFPHATVFVPGGCTVGEKTLAKVRVCPMCAKKRDEWLESHPEVSPYGYRRATSQ